MAPDLAPGWRLAVTILGWIVSLFGRASELAERVRLPRAEARRLRLWLRLAEQIVRPLVFAMAAEAPPANAPVRGSFGVSSGHGRGGFASADSADWSVRYQVLYAAPSARKRNNRTPRRAAPAAARLTPALALAERLEALIRICADPARFARRVARRKRRPPAPSMDVLAILTRPDGPERLFAPAPAGTQPRPALGRGPPEAGTSEP